MKLTKLNSNTTVNLNLSKYRVDWDRIVSKPQFAVKSFLKPYWSSYNIGEEVLIPGSRLRLDLVNWDNKVIVEISPEKVHTAYNEFMHKSRSGFLKKIKADESKMKWADQNGFLYVEIFDADLKNLTKEMFASKGIML